MTIQAKIHQLNRTQEFGRDADPSDWLELAIERRDAAEHLREINAFEAARMYTLLADSALEMLVKGLLVAVDPQQHIGNARASRSLKSRDLIQLVGEAGLDLSPEELLVVEHATERLQWTPAIRFPNGPMPWSHPAR